MSSGDARSTRTVVALLPQSAQGSELPTLDSELHELSVSELPVPPPPLYRATAPNSSPPSSRPLKIKQVLRVVVLICF